MVRVQGYNGNLNGLDVFSIISQSEKTMIFQSTSIKYYYNKRKVHV